MSEQDEDVTVDTNTEGEEATNSNEISTEGTVDQEEVERLRKANLEISTRARKAEAELKKLRESKAETPINSNPQLSDELKLIARGFTDEEIEQAKVVAKGKGIALTEAIKDPLFTIFQSDLKEKERKENAKLGASKGSGETQAEVTGTQFGSSREEHQEAFKKVMGT